MDMKLHSRKTFFLLLALTVVTGCRKDPFQSDLERLDRVIEQRDEYRERFEAGAVPIRQSFDKAESDSLRWVMAEVLYEFQSGFSGAVYTQDGARCGQPGAEISDGNLRDPFSRT